MAINRRRFLMAATGSLAGTLAVQSQTAEAAPHYQRANLPTTRDTRYSALLNEAITPNDAFFHQQIGAVPAAETEFTVGGMVEIPPMVVDGEVIPRTEFSFSLDDLLHLPHVERALTLACIGNPVGGRLMGTAVWRGVRFQDFVRRMNLKAGVRHVRFTGADAYQTALPLDDLDEALLVFGMNGAPLPSEQGYPLRLLVPGKYGQKMPKWIQRIDFIDYDFKGYWESRGLSDQATVQTHSLILSPPDGERVTGEVILQGVALAGLRTLTQVEIRVDGGPWIPAALDAPEAPGLWQRWHLTWKPETPGAYSIEVRATDDTGFTQSRIAHNPFESIRPNGTSAIHKITLNYVES